MCVCVGVCMCGRVCVGYTASAAGSKRACAGLQQYCEWPDSGGRNGDTRCGDGEGRDGNGKEQKGVAGPPSVTSVVFIDEYVLASAGANDGAVKLWDLRKSWNHEVPCFVLRVWGACVCVCVCVCVLCVVYVRYMYAHVCYICVLCILYIILESQGGSCGLQ